MIVITIGGILISVVGMNFSSTRRQARDAVRKSDVEAIQTALELYYNAHNEFPNFNTWATSNNSIGSGNWASLQQDLSPYLSSMPTDPVNASGTTPENGGLAYGYLSTAAYGCTGQWYVLVYTLEVENDPALTRSPGISTCNSQTLNDSNLASAPWTFWVGVSGS
ncbi:hypothetical protein HYW32_03310 [Candidatus Berkelbacteria bacterium]|nr:hypothetical protein [Candidatus Berkelbacteria bacterium]